jgi:hypothetical protein
MPGVQADPVYRHDRAAKAAYARWADTAADRLAGHIIRAVPMLTDSERRQLADLILAGIRQAA